MKKFVEEMVKSLKEIEETQDNTFEVIVSTDDIDRDGDSIKQEGIDLEDYMKNPVVLIDHKYTVDSIIGKTLEIEEKDGKTIARGIFSQTNPKAKLVQDLYNEGMLKTVSIGFISLETEMDRDNDVYNINKSSMLEFSFVAVPCNPNALSTRGKELYIKGLEAGMIKEEVYDIEKRFDEEVSDFVFDGDQNNITKEVINFIKKEKEDEKVEETTEQKILSELKSMKDDISEIKKFIADDKAKKTALEEGIENKKKLQEANNIISEALSLIKLASK